VEDDRSPLSGLTRSALYELLRSSIGITSCIVVIKAVVVVV
jgi:hypothetical protein